MKLYIIFITFFFINTISAQKEKINLIVTEINTSDENLQEYKKLLTVELEAIISNISTINLLERSNYEFLESLNKIEKVKFDSDSNLKKTIKLKDVNQVIIGSLYQNRIKKQYILEYSIINLETTKKLKEFLIFTQEEFLDTKLRHDKLEAKIKEIFNVDVEYQAEIDIGQVAWSNYKNNLAFYLLNKHKDKIDYPAQGLFELAYLYSWGLGTTQDHLQAKKIYERAIKMNHLMSLNNLGVMYQDGYVDGIEYSGQTEPLIPV